MKKGIIALTFLLLFCMCNGIDRRQSKSNDTLSVQNTCIVFYSPSSLEYKAMTGTTKVKNEIDEYLSDFQHYSTIVSDSLSKRGIKVITTTTDVIKVNSNDGKVTIINKKGGKHFAGMIISNGINAPLVVQGVRTSEEYFTAIHSYLKQ